MDGLTSSNSSGLRDRDEVSELAGSQGAPRKKAVLSFFTSSLAPSSIAAVSRGHSLSLRCLTPEISFSQSLQSY